MRLKALSIVGLAALAFASSGCGVDEQKVGTTAGNSFVSCFSKTNPVTVDAVDEGFQLYTEGKTVTGCTTGKQLTSKEIAAARAAITSYRARVQQQEQQREACKTAVAPVLAALHALNGRVTAGVTASEYSAEVGRAQGVAYQQGSAISATDGNCHIIADDLDKALSAYEDASGKWIDCMNDLSQSTCVDDSPTGLELQVKWTRAAQDVLQAQANLDALMKGATPTPYSSAGGSNASTPKTGSTAHRS